MGLPWGFLAVGLTLLAYMAVPASAQNSLSLPATLEQVFRLHPAIRAAQLRLEAAQAWARGAGAQPNPQLRLAAPVGDPSEEANALVQRWEIAGQPGLRSKIAELQTQQAQSRLKAQQREVGMKVVEAYYGLWSTRELEQLQNLRYQQALDLQAASARRLQLGQISKNEFMRSQLETAQAEAQWVQAQADAKIALIALNSLLQRPLTSVVLLPRGAISEEKLPLLTPEDRPEVTLAEVSAQVAHLEADLEGRQNWPDLEFEAYRSSLGAGAERGLRLNLVLPLWDWGQVGAAVEKREKEAEAAESELLLQRQNSELELTKAWEQVAVANERRRILQEQSERCSGQADLAQRGFQAGLLTLLEVLEAQRAYRQAMMDYLASEAIFQRCRWELYWLSGGTLARIQAP